MKLEKIEQEARCFLILVGFTLVDNRQPPGERTCYAATSNG